MSIRRVNIAVALVLFVIFGFTGCGGGGGGGGNGGGAGGAGGIAPSATFRGAVGGTTILALDDNDNIISIDDTAGRQADIDTDNDGIPDAFSFQLADLPLGQDIRLYLITGGVIYPVFFDTDGDGLSDTNVLSFTLIATIDLGFLDTDIPGEEGKAVPRENLLGNNSVASGGPDTIIPAGINTPPITGLALAGLIDKGLNALLDGWFLGARAYFEEAVNQAGSGISNDADTARFLYAVTRVIAKGFETLSDGDSSDMNRVGDILDKLGIRNDIKRANWHFIGKPDSLPSDSPDGNEYQDFLYAVVRPEIIAAIGNLDDISQQFNLVWPESPVGGGPVESDFGDVLILRGVFKSLLAAIATQRAYDLDADIDEISNSNHDLVVTNDITIEDFLLNNSNFMSLADTAKLTEARNYLTASALDDFDLAIDTILAETDPQDDDLITLESQLKRNLLSDPAGAEAKVKIAQARDSILNGATTVGKTMLDLQHFFDVGVDFRNPAPGGLLPPFSGNRAAGPFPDPTFDGVVLLPDLNEDLCPADGVPDILQPDKYILCQ